MNQTNELIEFRREIDNRLGRSLERYKIDPTLFTLINGTDAVVDDLWAYQHVNKVKNNWYAATAPSDIQNGMIWVDSDDGAVYVRHGGANIAIGKIAQVVTSTYDTVATKSTGFPDDDTIPQLTEGDEILSCAITPKNANSTIVAFYFGHLRFSTTFARACLFKSTSNDALQWTMDNMGGKGFIYTESAANTTVRTYSVRVGDSTGNNCFTNDSVGSKFGASEKCRLIVMEVLP